MEKTERNLNLKGGVVGSMERNDVYILGRSFKPSKESVQTVRMSLLFMQR